MYNLIVFIPGVVRSDSVIQVNLETYEHYDECKEACIRYRELYNLDAEVMDYSGKICYPYTKS